MTDKALIDRLKELCRLVEGAGLPAPLIAPLLTVALLDMLDAKIGYVHWAGAEIAERLRSIGLTLAALAEQAQGLLEEVRRRHPAPPPPPKAPPPYPPGSPALYEP